MLILTRKPQESVVVGEQDLIVTILGVRGNQVRLGFDADPRITIHREEIFNRIKQERIRENGGNEK